MRDFSPSMLLYGALPLFRTKFPRCHALLCFVTSSLASPMDADAAFVIVSRSVRNTRTVTRDRRARVERRTLRRLEDLPSLGSATAKMETRAFRLFGSVLERQNDLQPAKT